MGKIRNISKMTGIAAVIIAASVAIGCIAESSGNRYVATECSVPILMDIELPVINQKTVKYAAWVQEDTTQKEEKKKVKKTPKYLIQYKKLIDGKGIIVAGDDDEKIKIYEKSDKKSKIVGYAINNSVVKVKEKGGKWCKVKSGKIIGYVKAKSIVTDKSAESLIIDNGMLSAKVTAKKAVMTKKESRNKEAVGVGYKGSTYVVEGFSNNYKKVRIQKSDSVSGWIKTQEVSFSIDAPGVMTKEECEKYILEEQTKKEAEYAKAAAYAGNFNGTLTEIVMSMIAHNESGNYTAARNALSQFKGEKTITVGAWQWYGERAHNILRRIVNINDEKAKKTIINVFSGGKEKKKQKVEKLISDIKNTDNWESKGRKFTNEELLAVKAMLGTKEGKAIQDDQAEDDILSRIAIAKRYGITNNRLIAYFVDLYWQGPEHACIIMKKSIAHYDSVKEFNKDESALAYMHKIAKKDKALGKFTERRMYTYAVCSKIKLNISTGNKKKKSIVFDEDEKIKNDDAKSKGKSKTGKKKDNEVETETIKTQENRETIQDSQEEQSTQHQNIEMTTEQEITTSAKNLETEADD